ncbi:MAG: DivIVA domain-containing protein [Propioniciclava sp.]|uniref:DivIVA domain-containing protein n=1 Tax=Propioniciclava sp. TaxID=2038686 RepID=UPI0039E5D09B
MVWFLGLCAFAVLGLAALAGSGRFGELPPPVHDTPVLDLPAGALGGADLRALRFANGVRGYAPAQVDEVLGRLAAQLDAAQTSGWPAPSDGQADAGTHDDAPPQASTADRTHGF